MILLGIDLHELDAQQMGNLIYGLIIEESTDLGDRPKARQDLDAMLQGFAAPESPTAERDSWGLGPDAQDGLEAMKKMGL